ncbi:MAG: hypothetical protein JO356_09340 [Acidobacteria bacterium]|nr:hypothetical protein [Acidobacteriota bacterium]
MTALIASALLGLYVFAPYIIFQRISSLFLPLKRFQRSRTEEIVAGITVAGIPMAITLFLFSRGWIGGCCVPFPLVDSAQQRQSDYQVVFTAAYSDHYFLEHEGQSWAAAGRVFKRQMDFFAWNLLFVAGETLTFVLLIRYYWKLKTNTAYLWFAAPVLLPTISEWHVLLTDFNFPPKQRRTVEIDALSKDDILYRGTVVDHFLASSGELSGVLLSGAERFQYERLEEDRRAGRSGHSEEYWTPIPGGGHFYLPSDNIASLNIRYPLPMPEYERILLEAVRRLGLRGVSNLKVESVRRRPS